ncbi:MAG TPA: dethiobiotin synthase [Candidatus Baltobacteraceae bacterium]|jgi:dethiobiotin synthetase/malonyl-CoA O-methyltransferase|nr:dethiobiotin synthase [Candidatus Baltobacteraceae bacterium]
MRIFVTGTGTNVGKSVVSAWLCLHLPATYWKPIQSGMFEETDREFVTRLGVASFPETYRLPKPLSPHASAAHAGVRIRLDEIIPPAADRLVIEGAGGLLVPLNEHATIADLIAQLALPILIVAPSGLGTINSTCLTLEALRARSLPLLGVVMVGEPNPINRRAIEHFGETTVLGELAHLPVVDADTLAAIALPSALREACERTP